MKTHAALVLVALGILTSCGNTSSFGPSKPPEFSPSGGQGKCSVKGGQAKPLIVEWPSGARGDLELQVKRGIIPVRYVGCEMEILTRCAAPGSYTYGPFTAKGDKVVISNEDELYASIPVGAARFESKLQTAGRLTVDMKLVGKYEAERDQLAKAELKGACEGATHFIVGLTVGAFEFYAGAEGAVSGGGSVLGSGAGAKSIARRENLTQDGNADACSKATQKDTAPPDQCGAVLRLEVVPLGEAKHAEPSCPEGSSWNGTQCARPQQVAQGNCQPGTEWTGSQCVATVVAKAVPATTTPARPAPATTPAASTPLSTAGAGGMVRIPAGAFEMGANRQGQKSLRRVSVRPFEMDLTEVTVSAYRACVTRGQCTRPGAEAQCNWPDSGKDDHPINCVDWTQASAFCASVGKRLPTEEEWEYAARGPEGREYPWGSAEPYDQSCWNRGMRGTCVVGSHPFGDSRFGLHDMAGNVWEWTASLYSEAHDEPRTNDGRVIRGGSWQYNDSGSLRGTSRNYFGPSVTRSDVGFRCAR